MGENSSHPEMLIESNIAISIVWYIFIFNSMKTMGFECFPLPYRIFQFAGEFIISVPPKSDYYWIKPLPCYSIKDHASNPQSRSLPLFLPRTSFAPRLPRRAASPGCAQQTTPPPAIKIYHSPNNCTCNILPGFSGNVCSSLPVFVACKALEWVKAHHLQKGVCQKGN